MAKKKSNETKVLCPNCGTELAIPAQSSIAVGVIIGKDAGLGTVYAPAADKQKRSAQERIEALRAAGVDVSNLFAMQGANGGECIACNKDGKLSILDDNDPIFQYILTNGTIPNRKLFRRWVMAQMFYMMAAEEYKTHSPVGVTGMIHRLGYEYTWKMLLNELHAQVKMAKHNDRENFEDRHRWFNQAVVMQMAKHYISELQKFVDRKPEKRCKGVPYKTIAGKHIFVSDLRSKLYNKFWMGLGQIRNAKTIEQLYVATKNFNDKRLKLDWDTPQCCEWIDAYKGSGAYFTLQNMIRFHNCHIIDDAGKKLDKELSLQFIKAKATMYCNGDGWRMLAVLKKCLEDNNIDIRAKIKSWRKRK